MVGSRLAAGWLPVGCRLVAGWFKIKLSELIEAEALHENKALGLWGGEESRRSPSPAASAAAQEDEVGWRVGWRVGRSVGRLS